MKSNNLVLSKTPPVTVKEILPRIHWISLGGVNAYLIEDAGELWLIDTGYPGKGASILDALSQVGKRPEDLRHILVTHCHMDHAGGLAELQAACQATVYMHPDDAAMVEDGVGMREHAEVSPGLINRLVFRYGIRRVPRIIPAAHADVRLHGGETLPVGKGLDVIHVSGHSAGQLAFLYRDHGGVLFAADTCLHVFRLALFPFYEQYQQGLQDLKTLASLEFDTLTFGHGKPVVGGAKAVFLKKMGKYVM